MNRATTLATAALFCAALAQAQQPPSAAAVMDRAKSQAAESQRDIFAIFQASW
jgi:hypothetical protein